MGGQEPRGRDLGVGERAPSSECFPLVLRLSVSGDRGGGRGCREEFVFFPSFELDAPGAQRTGGADLLQEYRNETGPELPLPESPQALRVPLCCGRPPGCASDAAAAAFVPLGQCPLREQPK